MAWGRINTNSSAKSSKSSDFKQISEFDFSGSLDNKPSRFIMIKNDEELYYVDSSNNIKIFNINTSNVRSTGRTIESGGLDISDKYFIVNKTEIYSKSTLSKLATLICPSTFTNVFTTSINYDGDIYLLSVATDYSKAELYKCKNDFDLELKLSISTTGITVTPKLKNFVVDIGQNLLKIMFTNSSKFYYIEYNLSTGDIVNSKEGTTGSDGTTHKYSFCKLGRNVFSVDSYDSSSTYTNFKNGVITYTLKGYWIKYTNNIFPNSVLFSRTMFTGSSENDLIIAEVFPDTINNPVFLEGNILVGQRTNKFVFYNLGNK